MQGYNLNEKFRQPGIENIFFNFKLYFMIIIFIYL